MEYSTFAIYFGCRTGLYDRFVPFSLTISAEDEEDEEDALAVALNMQTVMGWEFLRVEQVW